MTLVQDTLEDEVERIIANIRAVLQEAKLELDHVIKTTIFLTEIADFQSVNEVYGKYFDGDFPARETVAVLALPKVFENRDCPPLAVLFIPSVLAYMAWYPMALLKDPVVFEKSD